VPAGDATGDAIVARLSGRSIIMTIATARAMRLGPANAGYGPQKHLASSLKHIPDRIGIGPHGEPHNLQWQGRYLRNSIFLMKDFAMPVP
jgi:hypothetical protein